MSQNRFNPSVRLIGLLSGLVVATLTAGAAAATFVGDDPAPEPEPLVVDMLGDTDIAGFATVVPDSTAATTEDTDAAPEDEVDEGTDGEPGIAGPGEVDSDWTDGADPASSGSVELDPATPEIDPCDLIADPEQHFVAPTVVELASGEFTGQLQIMNCSSGLLDVELSAANGLDFVAEDLALAPGVTTVDFAIDKTTVGVGAFELKFKVTQTGCCADYGDVLGFKQGFNPDIALDLPLTAGEGQGGCKAGCITTVWIEGNPLHTSVELNVGTKVTADIDVRVSTQAPVPNQAGDPSMPGVTPVLSTNGPATQLVGTIGDLDATTTYHLLVTATDDNGTSTFTDSFTTVDPVDHPDGFAGNDPNPGCSAGCITHAVIDDVTWESAHLTMATSMSATMQAFVGTDPVEHVNNVPTMLTPAFIFTTPEPWTSWQLGIDSLEGDTTYHVLLRATDANGKRDYQVGSFTTPPAPEREVVISVGRIDIKDNGDLIGKGEIRFGFAYEGSLVGTRGEQKLKEGATVWPDAYNFVVVDLAPDEATAGFAVWAGERDVSLLGFCEAPVVGLRCEGMNWNPAFTGPVTLADIAEMPDCAHYGFTGEAADDKCKAISDMGGIGDEVTFDAVIRYHLS